MSGFMVNTIPEQWAFWTGTISHRINFVSDGPRFRTRCGHVHRNDFPIAETMTKETPPRRCRTCARLIVEG